MSKRHILIVLAFAAVGVASARDTELPVMPPPTAAEIRTAASFCRMVHPEFPRAALRSGISGEVIVKFRVFDGEVTEVISMTGPEVFYPSVEAAIRKYKCRRFDNPVIGTQSFLFNISGQ